MDLLLAELVAGEASRVSFAPHVRAASATVELRSAANTIIVAPIAASLAAVDTTVTAVGATPDTVTLMSVAHLEVGTEYELGSVHGWRCKVRVGKIAGSIVTFEGAPPSPPQIGDTLKALTFTATIAAPTARDTVYRLTWRLVGIDDLVDVHVVRAAVVAARFHDPVGPSDVARVVQEIAPGQMRLLDFVTCLRIAEKANLTVRALLIKNEHYPHLTYNANAFREAGDLAIELHLLARSIVQNGTGDPKAARKLLLEQVAAAVSAGVAASWNDSNDNLVVEPGEVRGAGVITLERV